MDQAIQKRLSDFFSNYKLIIFKKGHIIYRPEDPITNIYFLKKGLVKQYIISEDGDEVVINLFRPNSFIPIMTVLSETPNRHFFESQEETAAYSAPTSGVINFIKSEPEVLFDLTTRFAKAINGLSLKFEEAVTKDASDKILSLISYLSEKFGKQTDKGSLINLPLTHQEVANLTGLTRETASRTLEKLMKDGLIINSNHQITLVTHLTDK